MKTFNLDFDYFSDNMNATANVEIIAENREQLKEEFFRELIEDKVCKKERDDLWDHFKNDIKEKEFKLPTTRVTWE